MTDLTSNLHLNACISLYELKTVSDDLPLLPHSFNLTQEKTHCLKANTGSVRLRYIKDKSKIKKVMTDCLQRVSLTKDPAEGSRRVHVSGERVG